jgi:hypothetical protein
VGVRVGQLVAWVAGAAAGRHGVGAQSCPAVGEAVLVGDAVGRQGGKQAGAVVGEALPVGEAVLVGDAVGRQGGKQAGAVLGEALPVGEAVLVGEAVGTHGESVLVGDAVLVGELVGEAVLVGEG